MRKVIIDKCMNAIKETNNYNEEKLAEIKYGLEGVYLTISKFIVIFILSLILGIIKEFTVFLLIYNIIRMPSFGLHATKSWICLLSSIIIFIGIPCLCNIIEIPTIIKVIIGMLLVFLIYKNAPADTYKRPIINPKRRRAYKFISTIIAIAYVVMSVVVKDMLLSNLFLAALIIQSCIISPTVYKIFKLPYDNYKNYLTENMV